MGRTFFARGTGKFALKGIQKFLTEISEWKYTCSYHLQFFVAILEFLELLSGRARP